VRTRSSGRSSSRARAPVLPSSGRRPTFLSIYPWLDAGNFLSFIVVLGYYFCREQQKTNGIDIKRKWHFHRNEIVRQFPDDALDSASSTKTSIKASQSDSEEPQSSVGCCKRR
jgi:hypothetical protein